MMMMMKTMRPDRTKQRVIHTIQESPVLSQTLDVKIQDGGMHGLISRSGKWRASLHGSIVWKFLSTQLIGTAALQKHFYIGIKDTELANFPDSLSAQLRYGAILILLF